MGNEVTINKTTALLFAGLFLAIVLGGYVVFANNGQDVSQTGSTLPSQAGQNQPSVAQAPAVTGGVQEVYLKATAGGYDKSEIVVKKGIPVRLHFTAQNAGCGSQLVIYGMNVKALSRNQEVVVEFTPEKEGTFEYNCGMKMMPPGRFVVTA